MKTAKTTKTTKRKPRVRIQDVPLRSIVCDPRCQTRDGLDEDHVIGMVETLTNGGELKGDKPVAFFDPKERKFYFGDGFHRFEASSRSGLKSMPCEVRKGTIEDAIEYAHRDANATNSLKLGVSAVRKKVEWHLASEKYRHFSDGQIARWCHCNDRLVSRYREESHSGHVRSEIPPQWIEPRLKKTWGQIVDRGGIPRLTINKHDQLAVVDVGKIGKAQQPQNGPESPLASPPTEESDAITDPSQSTQLDRIRAKIRKYADMPQDRADRLIAQEEVVPIETVRNVREYDSLTPPAPPKTETETTVEPSVADREEEGEDAQETPVARTKRSESSPEEESRTKPSTRGFNKGRSAIAETQLVEWRKSLKDLRNAYDSWPSWNPWLEYDLSMRSRLRLIEAIKGDGDDGAPDGKAIVLRVIDALIRHLHDSNPDHLCPGCDGPGCVACYASGFMPHAEYGDYVSSSREGDN